MLGYRVPAPDEAMLISGGKAKSNAPFRVVTGHGAPGRGPFDAIIVTAGAWEIARCLNVLSPSRCYRPVGGLSRESARHLHTAQAHRSLEVRSRRRPGRRPGLRRSLAPKAIRSYRRCTTAPIRCR